MNCWKGNLPGNRKGVEVTLSHTRKKQESTVLQIHDEDEADGAGVDDSQIHDEDEADGAGVDDFQIVQNN